MATMDFFAVIVLSAVLHGAVAQPGFLSIDCGRDGSYSGYIDADTGIFHVADGPYVDGGENHRVAPESGSKWPRYLQTLRSFPSGVRSCYALPTVAGAKYLVRLEFVYDNYDGKNSSSSTLQFDLHLGVNHWATVDPGHVYEAIFVAWASWTPVCLINTGGGTPFVSSVQLRPLGDALYPAAMANQSMATYQRSSMGVKGFTRYPDDPYDRFWWQMDPNPMWANRSTTSTIKPDPSAAVPLPVIQTAVEVAGNNSTMLNITWQDTTARKYMVLLHFADFQNSKLRQFNISFNDNGLDLYIPPYLAAEALGNTGNWYRAANTDGRYNITLAATAASVLPPMINSFEIYTQIAHDNPATFPRDFDAIMAIKLEYGIKKNWMGDPCFPTQLAWDGVKCSNTSGNTTRISSLDLSDSKLHGVISNNFILLTALEYLNLSGNQLNGPIPDSLCKNNAGSFVFSFDGDMCNKTIKQSPPKNRANRTAILAVSVVVPVMAIAVLVVAYFIWRQRRNHNNAPSGELELENAVASRDKHGDHLGKIESHRFTYKELQKCTNKFEKFIGQGGFGNVYYGRLEDDTEVAVKMRSESSFHGFDEFLAEVQSLTKVHHRNLVSLVGYCWEEDHLALVYEYMTGGSLCDHLRGNKGASGTLNWRTRVQIVVEAAQGLDYLHKGCTFPIIHRDVKTSNILLGPNLNARIADFGLSKTYLSDTQTHISITAAGSAGYIDPEYYHSCRLTERSDVYSFGVVLMELVTGESPILPGQGHIVQRVKNKIATGNISLIVDARLGGAYEVSSMWKVLDVALQCTADAATQRPTMAAVVVQLKEGLALEQAGVNNGFGASTMSDTTVSMMTFSPSAR